MSGDKAKIGLYGLAVMGQNLALNIASRGFRISVFNRTSSKTVDTVRRAEEEKIPAGMLVGCQSLEEFVQSIATPRTVIIMVKAGSPVDETIDHLLPLLSPGDTIMDCGNEWFLNSERRAKYVAEKRSLRYCAMGVSGGEEGARHGPSLMFGGPRDSYNELQPILEAIAAKAFDGDGACVAYLGSGGSGNYVKMVHNGIEYGDMQLIAEAYDLLKHVGGLTNAELAQVFDEWNQGALKSFLIEITAHIFRRQDSESKDKDLIDLIVDNAGSKGTGKMTVQEAAEQAVPAPTIVAALNARYISAVREERAVASKLYPEPLYQQNPLDKKLFVKDVENALYCSKVCSYAQGMALLASASATHQWKLQLSEIARIWKGGCIIRAAFLDRIKKAYAADPHLRNMLASLDFVHDIVPRLDAWRRVVALAVQRGVPVPAFGDSLAYFDSYRRERLPANLIQAQRDFFGAHTFERIDKPGSHHVEWMSSSL